MQRTITMTEKELERSKAIHMANEKRLTQNKGAQRLKISERHFRRLLKRYREKGDIGLVSGHRGKPSNNRMRKDKRQNILDLMLTTYQGFGPTLASEKLAERDRIQVSKETIRRKLEPPARLPMPESHRSRALTSAAAYLAFPQAFHACGLPNA